jgi:hypothetical protein
LRIYINQVALAEGDLEKQRVTVGLRLQKQEADFSKLIIFLQRNKNINFYEAIILAIVTTF